MKVRMTRELYNWQPPPRDKVAVGEILDLPDWMAEQFMFNEMAVAATDEELEAATAKTPRRR